MNNKKSFVLMYFAFFIYSLSGILSKLASHQVFMSPLYLLYFCGLIITMILFSFFWQQILKEIPLSVAMSNKPVVLIFSLFWAVLLFNERLSIKSILGIVFIILGIFVIGRTMHER